MKHPLIDYADSLHRLRGSAAAQGYRMPAEWEPQSCVWLTPPHNPDTWPDHLEAARAQFDLFVEALRQVVTVKVTQELAIPSNDSWIRDYGPIFVVDRQGRRAIHDFIFNAWGGKYEPWTDDDLVPQRIAKLINEPLWIHDFVLEGGSIDVNGSGTVLTTEQCLLHPNRNPELSREQIEQELHAALGTRHVIWLPGGIEGDDTDGHVDDVARFVGPRVVAAVRAPRGHPDHVALERNWQALRASRDENGAALELVELPSPVPIMHVFPPDQYSVGGRRPLPASHANFLISNGHVFVPIFDQRSDEIALRALERALPGHTIHGLRCERVVIGLGCFHCMSQQEPAPPAA